MADPQNIRVFSSSLRLDPVVSPPPHVQPYTGRECPYSAVVACNKCGWTAPRDGAR